jgi:hypothetical protein
MRVRIIPAGTPASARRTVSCVILAILVSTLVSGCFGSPSKTAPSIYSPSATSTASRTGTAPASATARATGTATARATGTASPSSTGKASATSTAQPPASHQATTAPSQPSHTPTSATTPYPTGAPQTGGGGTAGLQDGLLFGLGGTAILAGLGSLAYRRRLTRTR